MKTRELAAERVRLGYNQKQLAKKMGMTPVTFSYKERGIARFTCEEIVCLSEILGLNYTQVNDIFFDGKLPTG